MTAEVLLDRPPVGPERLRFHPLDAAINYAVNNPVKMLTLLALAEQPGHPFTGTEIKDRLNEWQGNEEGWRQEGGEGYKRFCQFSLVPSGLVVETEVTTSHGVIPAFEINEAGLEWGVPLMGVLLDLELRTDFSSQRTFGVINSIPPGVKDEMRASLVRMRVLDQVYGAQDRPMNLTALCGIIPRPKNTIQQAIEDLTALGMLKVLRKSNPADRMLLLASPEEAQLTRRTTTRAEIIAAQQAAAALYARGAREISGATLLDEVEAHLPGVNRTKLWQALADPPPPFLTYIDGARFGRNKGKDAPRTRLEITPESERIVEELVRSIEALRESPEYRRVAAARARQIMSDEGVVAYLMARAQANSTQTTYKPSEVLQRPDRAAGELLGWISLRQVLKGDGEDWRHAAACRKVNPEIFFGLGHTLTEAEAEIARPVCKGCDVRLQCLRWATVEHPEAFGMWGGATETERRELPGDVQSLLQLTKPAG